MPRPLTPEQAIERAKITGRGVGQAASEYKGHFNPREFAAQSEAEQKPYVVVDPNTQQRQLYALRQGEFFPVVQQGAAEALFGDIDYASVTSPGVAETLTKDEASQYGTFTGGQLRVPTESYGQFDYTRAPTFEEQVAEREGKAMQLVPYGQTQTQGELRGMEGATTPDQLVVEREGQQLSIDRSALQSFQEAGWTARAGDTTGLQAAAAPPPEAQAGVAQPQGIAFDVNAGDPSDMITIQKGSDTRTVRRSQVPGLMNAGFVVTGETGENIPPPDYVPPDLPFREGLTDQQKSSVGGLINSGRQFNETDAKNFAYSIGRNDWQAFLGMTGDQAMSQVGGSIVEQPGAIDDIQATREKLGLVEPETGLSEMLPVETTTQLDAEAVAQQPVDFSGLLGAPTSTGEGNAQVAQMANQTAQTINSSILQLQQQMQQAASAGLQVSLANRADLLDKINKTVFESGRTDILNNVMEQVGIQAKNEALTDIKMQMVKMQESLNMGLAQEGDRIAPMTILGRRQNKLQQQAAGKIGALASMAQVYQGDLDNAWRMADMTVNAMNADREEQINAYQFLLEMEENDISRLRADEKEAVLMQMDTLEKENAKAEKNKDMVFGLIAENLDAARQGGVSFGDSKEEALAKMAPFMGEEPEPFFKSGDFVDIMKTLPAGESMEIQDPNTGETYTLSGLKQVDANTKVIESLDSQGNLTITTVDAGTGRVINQIEAGAVGKAVAAGSAGSAIPKIVNVDGTTYFQDPTTGELSAPTGIIADARVQKQVEEIDGQIKVNMGAYDDLQSKLSDLQAIKDHPGLAASVGTNWLGRMPSLSTGSKGEKQEFIGMVEEMLSQKTLQTLVDLKAKGGTLGALSEKELAMLEAASTKIGAWKEDSGYGVGEDSFKREIQSLMDNTSDLMKAIEEDTNGLSSNKGSLYNNQQVSFRPIGSNITSLGQLDEEMPEYRGMITEYINEYGSNYSNAEIFEQMKQELSFNSPLSMGVNRSTPQELQTGQRMASAYTVGSKGGQCGSFTHKLVDIPRMGNYYSEKQKTVDRYGVRKGQGTPKIGDVLISDGSDVTRSGKPIQWGHAAVITGFTPDGKLILTESNRKGDETVTKGRTIDFNDPAVYGVISGKPKSRYLT